VHALPARDIPDCRSRTRAAGRSSSAPVISARRREQVQPDRPGRAASRLGAARGTERSRARTSGQQLGDSERLRRKSRHRIQTHTDRVPIPGDGLKERDSLSGRWSDEALQH